MTNEEAQQIVIDLSEKIDSDDAFMLVIQTKENGRPTEISMQTVNFVDGFESLAGSIH